jgi:predicted amidohydrolase
VLLPEASLTGYVSPRGEFDLARYAEPVDGASAQGLRALAVRHGAVVVGPLIEAGADGRVYNATVGFAPDGARVIHYRKRHPWVPERWATRGELPYPLVSIGGRKLTLAVCYDGHFVADEAGDVLREADVLLFPSAWVDDEDTRTPLLQEIAAAFDVAVVNANWGPGVVKLPGQGGSMILARGGGSLLAVARDGRADAEV